MILADPLFLVVGLLLTGALAWAMIMAARRRQQALASAGIAAPGRTGPGGSWLAIGGLVVLAIAVSGPSASVPVTHASGTVILDMDVSGSMGATDVAPSRLAAEQKAALSFIKAQPASVDIGVIAFEQGGLMAALPSASHADVATAVSHLKVGGGTSLGSAIIAALSAITRRTVSVRPGGPVPNIGYWPSATIVMFSDGQDEGEGTDAATAAAVAEKAGIHVDTVGIGTTTGTTVDVDGYHLFTALDPDALTAIAQATGGSYHPAGAASQLDAIASGLDLRLTVEREPLPLAGAFTIVALILLAAGAVRTILRTGRVI
jgi:Ca-activated chloride channel family protein